MAAYFVANADKDRDGYAQHILYCDGKRVAKGVYSTLRDVVRFLLKPDDTYQEENCPVCDYDYMVVGWKETDKRF